MRQDKMAVHFSSQNNGWLTPRNIIEATLACLGEIDLDPCSNSRESPNVPARTHYTTEDDGLSLQWAGRVYMNPPYGRGIEWWVNKLCGEYEVGEVTSAIALLPARPGSVWWERLREYPRCLIRGRLTFVGAPNTAPFPSAVFYLGEDKGAFVHAFFHLGDVWQRVPWTPPVRRERIPWESI